MAGLKNGYLITETTNGSSLPTPDFGQAMLFIDSNNVIYVKNSSFTRIISGGTSTDFSSISSQILELSGNSISQASQIAALSANSGSSLTLTQVSNASANAQIQTTNNLAPLIFSVSGMNISQSTQIAALSANQVGVYLVDSFGAIGDGVTDDTSAIQAAISAAPPGSIVRFNGSKTYWTRSLGTIRKNLTIDGNGCKIICDITNSGTLGNPLFCFAGTKGTTYACSAASEGSIILTIGSSANALNFSSGDYALLTCTDVVPRWDGGTTQAPVPKIEIVRIASISASNSVFTIENPLSYTMSGGVTIAKLDMIYQPNVINFSSISEVSPISSYSGANYSGPNSPNIIDFSYCVQPKANYIYVNGWNLQLCCMEFCVGGMMSNLKGDRPFNPTFGGTGNVCRIGWSRETVASHCYGVRIRHLVDYYGALDCSDEYCSTTTDPDDINAAAFITHGYLSKRIKSLYASSSNGQGWSVGNPAYAGDSDVLILGYNYFGGLTSLAANSLIVSYGCENVTLSNCNVESYAGGLRLFGNPVNTKVTYCTITNKSISGASAVHALDVSGFAPQNVYISNCYIKSGEHNPSIGLNLNAIGDVNIKDNEIAGNVGIYAFQTTTPENLRITNNKITVYNNPSTAITVGLLTGSAAPSGMYYITDNQIIGSTSSYAIRAVGSSKLKLVGNRADDSTNKFNLQGPITIRAVVAGGGKVEDNGSISGDIPSSYYTHTITAPTGTSKTMIAATDGVWRWGFGGNSVAETGGNAGTDFEIRSYTDSGTYQDAPIYISRPSTGSMSFIRSTIFLGSSSMSTDQATIFRTVAGKNRSLEWQSGSSTRWRLRVDSSTESGSGAGSNLTFLAYDDSGNFVDSPLTIARRQNGFATVLRPLIINNSTACTTPEVSGVNISNGTIRIGRTTDATSDEVVRGNDSRLAAIYQISGTNISQAVQIASLSASVNSFISGSNGSVSGIQGRVQCISGQTEYTISHSTINTSANFPVVSLEVSDQNDTIFVQGIYDRQPTSFKVVLGGTPNSNNAILYHISTQSATTATTLQTTGGLLNITPFAGGYNIELSTLSKGSTIAVSGGVTTLINTIETSSSSFVRWFVGISDSINYRASNVMATTNGISAVYTASSTSDIGNTSNLSILVDISGSLMRLKALNSGNSNYLIKYTREIL